MTATTPPAARLETGLAALGSLRWVAADITGPLEEARRRLDLSPLAAVALGRGLTGAVLLHRLALKVPARTVVEVIGDGPLGKIIAEAHEGGGLRGLVGDPQAATPASGRLEIAPSIGRGRLRVTRESGRRRYSSQVQLVSGELGDDFTHFLEQSEQIRSAVLLGVLPKPTGIAAAGGLAVEALPGTDGEAIGRLEQNIRTLEGVSACLEAGGLSLLEAKVLQGFDRERLDHQGLAYRCRCSRSSLSEQLRPIARQDPEGLLGEAGECEAVCAFCGARYLFTATDLAAVH